LVLLVDDDESTYELHSEVLAQVGYAIVGASDGEQAVEAARRLVPDLIVMDLGIPKLDGCSATRLLKSDARTRHIPILVVTGYLQKHHYEAALAAGCDAFLTKPCRVSRLLQEIQRYAPCAVDGGHQILLIEDDADVSVSISGALADEGHPVAVARNGRDALEYLRTHAPPKVILLDLMMPVMDGWSFRAAQKQDPRWASIPVVVLSAVNDGKRVAQLAANDFLAKPLELSRLRDAVERYLSPTN
jgi:CheY-like chemotaxis protein